MPWGSRGGVPCQVQLGGVPWLGGYPGWGVPWPGGTLPGGGTQLGQHREYLLHGGRYASCVHAGGLSCFTWVGIVFLQTFLTISVSPKFYFYLYAFVKWRQGMRNNWFFPIYPVCCWRWLNNMYHNVSIVRYLIWFRHQRANPLISLIVKHYCVTDWHALPNVAYRSNCCFPTVVWFLEKGKVELIKKKHPFSIKWTSNIWPSPKKPQNYAQNISIFWRKLAICKELLVYIKSVRPLLI